MNKPLLGLILGVVIIAAGVVGYAGLFHEGAEEPEWVLASYSGGVEVATKGGEWRPAEMKVRLRGADRIRAGADGEATLVSGESHVTVRSDSELAVSELRPGLTDFRVNEGLVFVEARGTRIRTTSFAGQVADAEDAGFGMSVTEEGLAVVQVKRGEIDFRSGGHTERVQEGEQSQARAGRPPSRPVRIPKTLLLNVRFPDADTFNTRLARIEGRSEPGSRVFVDGRRVVTDAEGRFAAEVELQEGMNQIEAVAVDAAGRRRVEASRPIRVDTEDPFLAEARIGRRSVDVDGESR
jgi:hypothetical protein